MSYLKVSEELYQHRLESLKKLIDLKAPACIIRMSANQVVKSVHGLGWRHHVYSWYVSKSPRWLMMLHPSTRSIVLEIEEYERMEDEGVDTEQ